MAMSPATIGKVLNVAESAIKGMKALPGIAEKIMDTGRYISSLGDSIATTTNKWMDLQDIAFDTARTMGMTREAAMRMDRALMDNIKTLGREYGTSAQQIAQYQQNYVNNTGKNIQVTKDQIESIVALGNVTDATTASKLIEQFDTLGVSIQDSLAYTGQLQERAKQMGVAPVKAARDFAENIHLATTYSFKNGVDDIENMVIKSERLKMNIQSVMQVADKMSDIQGSIETGAQLQMLGGGFAAEFSNPMGTMYNAIADPAALQDQIAKAVQGSAVYDTKTGQARLNPLDAMRIKEAAKAMGISAEELSKAAISQAQNAAVDKEIDNSKGWSEADRAAIENLSRSNFNTETGQHYITYTDENGHDKQVDVRDITKDQLQAALDSQKTEENMFGDVHAIKEVIVGRTKERAQGGVSMKKNLQGFGESYRGGFAQLENPVMNPISSVPNGENGLFGEIAAFIPHLLGQVHFAEGGIVPGTDYTGDNVAANLNSGEMVINRDQQSGLFSLLTSLGKLGATAFIGNKIGNRVGMQGLGTGAAISSLGDGQGLVASLVQTAIAKRFGPIGGMIAGMDPLTAMIMSSGSKGIGINAPKVSSPSLKGVKSFSITSQISKATDAITKAFPKTASVMEEFGSKLSSANNRLGNFASSAVNWLRNSRVGRLASQGKEYASSKMSNIADFGSDMMDKMSDIKDSLKNSRFGRWTNNIAGKVKGVPSRVANFARNGITKFTTKTSIGRGIAKGVSGAKTLGGAVASDLSGLASAGKNKIQAIARLGRMKGFGKLATSSVGSKVLSAGSKFLGSGAGAAVKGIGKKIPILGTALSVLGGVGGIASASSEFDAKKAAIESSDMSEDDKKKAINEATDEKRGEQGKAVGSAIGAIAGGAIGTTFGPVGTIVGGFIGEKIGGVIGGLAKPISKLARGAKQAVSGAVSKAKSFLFGDSEEDTKAKANQSLSDKLNDPQLAEKAQAATISIYELLNQKLGNGIGGGKGLVGNALSIATAPLSIGAGIGKAVSRLALSPISLIKSVIGGKESNVEAQPYGGKNTMSMANSGGQSINAQQNIGPQRIDLNVSGTIKLDLGGQQANIDVNKLLNNPAFRNKLTEIVSRSMNTMSNAGKYNKEGNTTNSQAMYNQVR